MDKIKEQTILNDTSLKLFEKFQKEIFDVGKRKCWLVVHAMLCTLNPNLFCNLVSEDKLDELYKRLLNIKSDLDKNCDLRIYDIEKEMSLENGVEFDGEYTLKIDLSKLGNEKFWKDNNDISWYKKSYAMNIFFGRCTSDSSLCSDLPWATLQALEGDFSKQFVNVKDKNEYIEKQEIYGEEMFLEDVYMDKNSYEKLIVLVKNKKNIILQGPPGVGKTFMAKRLAYSMMGVKDSKRIMMVQFHQSYSYEDFIMGFRPCEKGFELKKGPFYRFCEEANKHNEDECYFFIIDEINRGNLSKIFGELLMLIESDKRGDENLQLLYSDEEFSVPKNVYIIGMMNTADRSLAMLDYALRRRFAFYEMKSGFETKGFIKYQKNIANNKFDKLIEVVKKLNDDISKDESLVDGFCIGHSYFCNLSEVTDYILSCIVEYELIPLLKEYWFDEPNNVVKWIKILEDAIK